SAGGVAFVDLNGGGPSPCVAGSKSVIIHTPNTMGGFNPYVSVVNPSILNAFAVLALSVGTTGKSDLAVLNYDTNTLTLLQNTTAYTPPFKIFRIPPNGPKRGGYPVDITGVGFREGDRVFFGNRQAFIVRVLDGETIECIPPDASDAQNPDFRVIIKVVHSDNSATAISPGVYEYQDRWGAVPVDPNGPPASEPMGRPGGITGGPPPPAPPGRHAVGGSGGNVPAAPPQPAPVPQRR
ncbi:MAG: IPT/TIG domain-containing protein, partial [Chloroflexota bacterium]|nr:IPT/TIG domain-containing protein [Chloroflexota bacterium]